MAYRLTGQYKEAIETAREALKHVPNNQLAYLQLVTAYSMAGQEQEARAAASHNRSLRIVRPCVGLNDIRNRPVAHHIVSSGRASTCAPA
jgi:Flp pilus assembly protein TadD